MIDISLYVRNIRSAWKVFGLLAALKAALLLPQALITHALLALDTLFFPGYRHVQIQRPIFIIGHPRSGTTFFHRLITQTDEYATFKLWQILIPSLTGRAILRPFLRLLKAVVSRDFDDRGGLFREGAHDTGADTVEEEEVLFMHRFDSQFNEIFCPLAFDEQDHLELLHPDMQPIPKQDANMAFFKACLQRQIYATGKGQIVAKMPYGTMRVKALLRAFPDARIIYLVRSPAETIPSHLSLHRGYFVNRWGLNRVPQAALQRYYQRRYRQNVALYRYFHNLEVAGELPADRVKVIHYDHFISDLENAFADLVKFTGMQVSEALQSAIQRQARKQSGYRRGHQNLPLESFGLSQEQLLKDLGFVYDAYGIHRPEESPAPVPEREQPVSTTPSSPRTTGLRTTRPMPVLA